MAAHAHLLSARAAIELQANELARRHVKNGLAIANQGEVTPLIFEAHAILGELEYLERDVASALHHYRQVGERT